MLFKVQLAEPAIVIAKAESKMVFSPTSTIVKLSIYRSFFFEASG